MTQASATVSELKARLSLADLLVLLQFPPPKAPHHYRSRCLIHGGNNATSFSAD